jgi:hypothetical protein
VVGCTTGSKEQVPGERKPVIRDDDTNIIIITTTTTTTTTTDGSSCTSDYLDDWSNTKMSV